MTHPIVRATHSSGVTLRMHHGKVQALDLELVEALDRELAALESAAPTLILTGTGSAFSAGVDLRRLLAEDASYVDRFLPALSGAMARLFAYPGPVVAAVNGHAIAGGCVLALACDYKVMVTERATIGVPELKVGVPFPVAPLEILRFALADPHLQELVYLGRTYTADAALTRGMVDEIVPTEQLARRAEAVAEHLSAGPAARFRLTKQQLRRPALDRMVRDGAVADPGVLEAWKDPATRAAIRAYLDGLKR